MWHRPVNIVIARLCYGSREHPGVGDWLCETMLVCSKDPRIERVHQFWLDESPVIVARNLCVQMAGAYEADYLCMIDATDQHPDCVPEAPTFWKTAFDFAYQHEGPCVITAPTPMANDQVNVHTDTIDQTGVHLRCLRMDECADKTGIERVPACGTGLILIDTKVFRLLSPPFFRFLYNSEMSRVVAGEDVIFTADCGGPRIPIYAAWDCWSDHIKPTRLTRPRKAS